MKQHESKGASQSLHRKWRTHLRDLTKLAAIPLLFVLATAVRGQSALDGFDPNANGTVRVVVVQPDGRILIGGSFTTLSPNGGVAVMRNHIARLKPDGTLDTAFNPNANDAVYGIALQADGRILAVGDFSGPNSIGGQTRNHIARLDATTGLADSFDPNANASAVSVAIQTDGKILTGGSFTSIGGQTHNYLVRLDPTTGAVDTSFHPNSDNFVDAIAIEEDGKILVGGSFAIIGGQTRNYIARLDAATGLADSFDPNANNGVQSIAVQADGKILAGGDFTVISGQARNHVVRFDATTGLADSFNPNADGPVDSIVVQADGEILVGGFFTSVSGQTRNNIARLGNDGVLDPAFNPNANTQVFSIAVQADGKIVAGGLFFGANGIGGQTRNRIARLEIDGRVDQALNLAIVGAQGNPVSAITSQPDGKFLIGGHFSGVLGVPRNRLARLNTDGTLDTAFNPNANDEVYSTAVQTDGKVLVGGNFTIIGGQPRNRLARLEAATGLADLFNPSGASYVLSTRVLPNGHVLVGGNFKSIGGQPRNNIAQLVATTGLADSFDPNADSVPYSVMALGDGKVLACGFFTSMGGQTRNHVARVNSDGTLDAAFNPNADNLVVAMAVQADGKILVAGTFSSIGGQARHYLARLDPTTGLADSFNPNPVGSVESIAVQANGKILVSGGFTSIGVQARRYVARLDPVTGLADAFNPDPNSDAYTIALQGDGKIFASGDFTTIGGAPRNGFARLTNDTAALQNLVVTRTTISWMLGGSSPQFTRVSFEYSPDNVGYTNLGSGTAAGSNWIRTGLNLPGGSFYIRARGYYPSGEHGSSESTLYSVRNAFLAPTAVLTTASSATIIGGTMLAVTTLSGGLGPTGTITFNVYGPDDPTCGGAVAFTSTSTVNGNGNYGSGSFTPTLAGAYRFVVIYSGDEQNASSTSACNDAGGSVVISKRSPTITTAASPSVMLGGSVSDNANVADGLNPTGTVTFTLFGPDNGTCAGTPIFTSTKPVNGNGSYNSDSFAPTSPGTYRFVVTYSGDANNNVAATACDAASGSVVVNPLPGTFSNISTRLRVLSGDNVLIGGMIATGTTGKRVILRAIGPSLTNLGVPGALEDPTLELFQGSTLLFSNDDWQTSSQQAEIAASGFAPGNAMESAIIWTLTPNQGYTAIVRGKNGTTGIGVIEAYDLDHAPASKLGNISTRGFVDVDDNVMIAGVIVGPGNGTNARILARALGPTLSDLGVPGALVDPTLDLVNASGTVIRSNDNWKDDPLQRSAIEAAGLAPGHDEEAALIETVAPGAYTAIVRGSNRTAGVGLVEAYHFP
jgi:uncharacterized delta-60 repeat protein